MNRKCPSEVLSGLDKSLTEYIDFKTVPLAEPIVGSLGEFVPELYMGRLEARSLEALLNISKMKSRKVT